MIVFVNGARSYWDCCWQFYALFLGAEFFDWPIIDTIWVALSDRHLLNRPREERPSRGLPFVRCVFAFRLCIEPIRRSIAKFSSMPPAYPYYAAGSSSAISARFSSQNSVMTFSIIASSASTGKPAASQ